MNIKSPVEKQDFFLSEKEQNLSFKKLKLGWYIFFPIHL